MGNQQLKIINFEDVKSSISLPTTIIINTLPTSEQSCLIKGSYTADKETEHINTILSTHTMNKYNIIIYGRNSSDEKIITKYNQFLKLGFKNVFIYLGGLFEWLLLQDIYGAEEFQTTSYELDFLKYKARSNMHSIS